MNTQLKAYYLKGLKREAEVVAGLEGEFPAREGELDDIQHKIDNIDEYVAYMVSREITWLLECRKNCDDGQFKLDVGILPEPMKTDKFIEICQTLNPTLCAYKGLLPQYDDYHQQLYEACGFTGKLPTFIEIERLKGQLSQENNLSENEKLEKEKELELKKHKLGICSSQEYHSAGTVDEMEADIIAKYDKLMRKSGKTL